jgi:mono/diheme cytochrome c family protein
MYDLPSIRAFKMMLVPPEGTLPVEGGQLPMTRIEADQWLKNPLPATADSAAEGQRLFMMYCAACHGQHAKGDGPVAEKFIAPPPDLTSEFIRARSDGFIFGTIRYGGVLMPALGTTMSPAESWAIVNYLRSIQKP